MRKAMQAAPDERARIVDEESAGDETLRAEVMSLLAELRDDDANESTENDPLRNIVLEQARALSASRAIGDVEMLRATLQQNLGDSYEILSTLGVGGMGAVFLARERALDRFVAIKTLRAEQAVTAASRERFRREARIAASLSHPGILPLHSFGETGGMWYLVMGYVQGQSLAQRIHAEGSIAPDEAWRLLRALADALDYAHEHQIIHRDIKPSNVLIDGHGRPLLTDFGISKVAGDLDALTQTGDLLGTPHFMSPEQIANARDADVQSDVYSLGAVAYAMLSGRAPLADIASSDLLVRRSSSLIVPLERVAPSVPADLAAVVMRCLATRAEDRWPTARALREALDRAEHGPDSGQPVIVRDMTGFGAYTAAWFFFWIVNLPRVDSAPKRAVIVLLALLVPIGLVLQIIRSSSPSVRWTKLVQVAFWPPLWWGMWWPRRFRRPDDLWKQLPWPSKATRIVMSVFIAMLPLLAFDRGLLGLSGAAGESSDAWFMVAGGLLLFTVTALVAAFVWTRQFKLSLSDDFQFLLGSTAPSAFWKRREVVRLLRYTQPGVRPPERDVPQDYVRAIDDLKRICPAEIAYALDEPAAMAHQLARIIADLDREIGVLEHDAPTAELARADARLVRLRGESSPAVQTEQHRALIGIVESELTLLREIQQRKVLAQNESAKLFVVLKSIWTELLKLSDSSGAHPDTASRVAELVHEGNQMLGRHHVG